MWTVTLFLAFSSDEARRIGTVVSVQANCMFYEIGQTILFLTNHKDEQGLGEIQRIEIVPAD